MAVGPSETKRILAKLPLFSGFSEEAFRLIMEGLDRLQVAKGGVVFRTGDPGDCLYIVRSGEVRMLLEGQGKAVEVLGSARRGHIFGETSLLTGSPRSFSAIASLDSNLLVLRKAYFDVIVRKSASAGVALSKMLAQRLRERGGALETRQPVGILCLDTVLPVLAAQPLGLELARYLAMEFPDSVAFLDLGDEGPTAAKALGVRETAHLQSILDRFSGLSKDAVRQLSGEPHNGFRLLALRDRSKAEARLRLDLVPQLMSYLKEAFACVVIDLCGRAQDDPLRERMLQQADRVVFLDRWESSGRSGRWGRTRDILEKGREGGGASADRIAVLAPRSELPAEPLLGAERPRYILQMEDIVPPGGGVPTGIRPTVPSLGRIVRHLSGTAVGLALGGGGARACAHLGVLKVLEAENIPVDLIGGTNVGALIGGLYAYGLSAADVEFRVRAMLKENPFGSGDKVLDKWLRQLFSDAVIEGLPIPFFAVAADLQSGREVVFRDDLTWKGVRASLALPGVFSPVYEGERCLADGLAVNNVPGDVCRRLGARVVVGVNVTCAADAQFLPTDRKRLFAEQKAEGGAAGWLGRFIRQSEVVTGFLDEPSVMQLLHRSLEVQAVDATRRNPGQFDLLLEPEVAGLHLLDFNAIDRAIEAGEKAAAEAAPKIRERLAKLRRLEGEKKKERSGEGAATPA
ncbi:MAG: cyclic nucleotide-binding domain-containing protein [Planctomycetes bacterium]|nr:cyclic nucleotide-binding domain-containing protein [Planctomycetota bacterium]